MSLGFEEAGVDVVAAFDKWAPAVEIYRANFNHPIFSHILTKKSTKQKRNLCYSGTVSAADEAKIKNLLVK